MALNKFLAAHGKQSIDDDATKVKNLGIGIMHEGFEFVMRDIDIENDTFNYECIIKSLLKDLKINKENETKNNRACVTMVIADHSISYDFEGYIRAVSYLKWEE